MQQMWRLTKEECLITLKALSASYTLPTHTMNVKHEIIVASKAAVCLGRLQSYCSSFGVTPQMCTVQKEQQINK